MSFYVLSLLKKEFEVKKGFFLVTIDQHNDLTKPSPKLIREITKLDFNNLPEIKKFAKTKLGKLNEDWIYSAMEAGLVTDVLIISPRVPHDKQYTDYNAIEHQIFSCCSPDDLSGYNGILTDHYPKRNRELQKKIGFPKGNVTDIILDIDLDYFTYTHNVKNYVMDRNNFIDIFNEDSLIWWIRHYVKAITIAKEHSCCGGAKNSRRILKALKRHFLSKKIP